MMKKYLILLLAAAWLGPVSAQADAAFTNEVTEVNGLVYFHGKPFTGTLYSDDEGIPNDCECTLKAHYRNGVLHGWKRQWYANGKKKFEGRYVNGKPVGTHKYYYPNGHLKKKAVYDNGRLVSSMLYNRDGTPKGGGGLTSVPQTSGKQATRQPERPKPKTHKPRTPVRRKEQADTMQEADDTGLAEDPLTRDLGDGYVIKEEDFPDNSKKKITVYLNDIPVKDTLFYLNGFPKEIHVYENGQTVLKNTFYETGVLHTEEHFRNGKKHGIQKEFYENRRLKSIEKYENGLPVHIERYNEKGQLITEENYKNGKKHGLQQRYNEAGELTETADYENGRLIRRTRLTDQGKEIITTEGDLQKTEKFDAAGRIRYMGFVRLSTGRPDSLEVYYNPATGYKEKEILYRNGQPVYEGRFRDGVKHGKWKYYLPGGKGVKIVEYDNGSRVSENEVLFDRQIKNLVKDGDYVFEQTQFYPEIHKEYYLIHVPVVHDKERRYILDRFFEVLNRNAMRKVEDTTGIGDYQVDGILSIDSLATRLRTKDKRYLYLIYTRLHFKRFPGMEKKLDRMIFYKHPSGELMRSYVKDKKDAYFKSLDAFGKEMKSFVQKHMPLKIAARPVGASRNYVESLALNAGANAGLRPKMLLTATVQTEKGPEEIVVVVEQVSDKLARADVFKGRLSLRKYFQNHKLIMLKPKE